MRLAIFTHVMHDYVRGNYFAYSPYIREMNLWLYHVKRVEVLGLQNTDGKDNAASLPYKHPLLTFNKVPSFNLSNYNGYLRSIIGIPITLFRIVAVMRRADHLHLRCPGNIGLLASVCQIFFPGKQKSAKYAGNWDPDAKQPWSYQLQRWILSNTFLTRNMTVLVYGQWPDQPINILPFFTASFSYNEIENIQKDFDTPYKFLFVGNLVHGKQPLFAEKLVTALNERNIPAELHIYGDGILKNELEIQAENKDYIHMHGIQPLENLKQAYKESHFLILASKSEGWPKAVAEAMFYGCIPIVTSISCVPWMVGSGTRGILIPEKEYRTEKREKRNKVEKGERKVERQDVLYKVVSGRRSVDGKYLVEGTVDKIFELLNDPEEMRRMSMEAQEWSQGYTLEKFEEEIKKVLKV